MKSKSLILFLSLTILLELVTHIHAKPKKQSKNLQINQDLRKTNETDEYDSYIV